MLVQWGLTLGKGKASMRGESGLVLSRQWTQGGSKAEKKVTTGEDFEERKIKIVPLT